MSSSPAQIKAKMVANSTTTNPPTIIESTLEIALETLRIGDISTPFVADGDIDGILCIGDNPTADV